MPTKKDATSESTEVTFNGDTYLVPPAEDWDIDVLEAIDENKLTTALRALIGDEQYEKYRTKNRKVRDLGEFFKAASEKVNAPNS